jgi:hypothetical protein
MRRFLVLLIPFVLFAQVKRPDPSVYKERPPMGFGGSRYCGGGLTDIPQTMFQAMRDYLRGPAKGIVHVTFVHDCSSKNPGAKTPSWMWVLRIKDVTNPDDSISNLRTLNESANGMDIEGIRGHTVDWTVTTR